MVLSMRYVDPHGLKIHPKAKHLMPPMPDAERKQFDQDIGTFGVTTGIMLLDGMVIDGRERVRAATERMVDSIPAFEVTVEGETVEQFILSLHKYRKPPLSDEATAKINKKRIDAILYDFLT